MMQFYIYKSSLKEYLAEEILRTIYAKRSGGGLKSDLSEMNYNYVPTENILKKYARTFQTEINKRAAMIVIESLSEEKKKMLKMKYGEQKRLVAISLALNVSVAQLEKRNQSIIIKIACFLGLRLMQEDVFCKNKIIGMIKLLSKSIEFFAMLSGNFEIRQDWLKKMERRKNNYQKLLERIQRLENEGAKNSFNSVILTKIKNPESSLIDITEFCGLNQSVVSRYLNKFANSVNGYLM